jgi:carbamoyl-phosphate synthase small subunit
LALSATAVGEVCFNTSMTGYQEILTDPSYAGQIITFTFPHIGNVGTNPEDIEAATPAARGLVCARPTEPSNFRATRHLDAWLKSYGLVGISGVDTRRLTRRIRDGGAPNGVLAHAPDGGIDIAALRQGAGLAGLEGMDLALEVSCRRAISWNEAAGRWRAKATANWPDPRLQGRRRRLRRSSATSCAVWPLLGCAVTVVPADGTAEDILRHQPDGVFLSNGPGDPAATGVYALPAIRRRGPDGQADLRHLPRPPDAGAGAGRAGP